MNPAMQYEKQIPTSCANKKLLETNPFLTLQCFQQ